MITLPKVPGIIFAYDARQGVELEPLEAQAVGKFEYATAKVEDISRNTAPLVRRNSGVDPYRAMQVPYSPRSGMNGIAPFGSYPDAYAPAFDMLAEQQSDLESVGFEGCHFGSPTFLACSFVVLAAMRAPTVTDARLLSYMGIGGTDGGQDDGRHGCVILARDALTNAIKTTRGTTDVAGGQIISTPIVLDKLYRFGVVMDETIMTHYLDNVAGSTGLQYTTVPMNSPGQLVLGGRASGFSGHNGTAWDGPIYFAVGANVAWSAEELAVVDNWIVEEFGLAA